MEAIRNYIRRRRTRKLAERILAGQIAYECPSNREERVRSAIETANEFYRQWELKD